MKFVLVCLVLVFIGIALGFGSRRNTSADSTTTIDIDRSAQNADSPRESVSPSKSSTHPGGVRNPVGIAQNDPRISSAAFQDAKRCHQAAVNAHSWQGQLSVCRSEHDK